MNNRILAVLLAGAMIMQPCGIVRAEEVSDETFNENYADESDAQKPTGFDLEGCEFESEKQGFYIYKASSVDLYGMVDANGNVVLPAVYDEMEFLDIQGDVVVKVLIEGKWGVYDTNGNQVLLPEYEMIESGKSKYLVQKDGKQSLLDKDGNLIKELTNEYVRIEGDDFLIAQPQMMNELYDMNENKISEYGIFYENNLDKSDKELIYTLTGENSDSYRVIDSNGNTVFQQENNSGESKEGYSVAFVSSDRYLTLQKWILGSLEGKNEYYLYDMIEQKQSDIKYLYIREFNNDKICCEKENGLDIYDEDGNVKSVELESGYSDIKWELDNPIIAVKYGETYRLYNSEGQRITEDRYLSCDFRDKYVIIQNLNGEYGLMDESGEMKVPFGQIAGDGEFYLEEEIESISSVGDYLYILTDYFEGDIHLYII